MTDGPMAVHYLQNVGGMKIVRKMYLVISNQCGECRFLRNIGGPTLAWQKLCSGKCTGVTISAGTHTVMVVGKKGNTNCNNETKNKVLEMCGVTLTVTLKFRTKSLKCVACH